MIMIHEKRFIKYIFENFYPNANIYLDNHDYIDFDVDDEFEYLVGMTKIMC